MSAPESRSGVRDGADRIRTMFDTHYDFVWRSLRRLGVPPDVTDDAAQEVFVVAARRVSEIGPASERSFLYGTALRVASDARRARARRPEDALDSVIDAAVDPTFDPETLAARSQARARLDQVLDAMPIDERSVFTLFELEGMTMAEIAQLSSLPPGTVASRLRRARETFQQAVARLDARGKVR